VKITSDMLRCALACGDQLNVFEAEWPNGCTVDETVIHRAVALKLEIDFAARKFLPAPARKTYEEARALALIKIIEKL